MRFWHAISTICIVIVFSSVADAMYFPRIEIRVTLLEDALRSKLVVYGRLENARQTAEGGTTDLVILNVLLSHPVLQGRKTVQVPRYLPSPDPKKPRHLIVFGDVVEDKPDVVRGIVAGPAAADYLKGLLVIQDKSRVGVLCYCAKYLDHADEVIRTDAHHEFQSSPDQEIGAAARYVQPTKLRRWLQDPSTEPERLRLYAVLLGHCGTAQDGPLFRALVKKLASHPLASHEWSSLDGVLVGYTLVDPKRGWQAVREQFVPPTPDWRHRSAALRAVRFFHGSRPGFIPEKEILGVLFTALKQGDVADFAIEDLRVSGCWQFTESILPLLGKASHDYTGVRRAILRYALTCPDMRAAHFVAQQRREQPAWVQETEEILHEEKGPPAPIVRQR